MEVAGTIEVSKELADILKASEEEISAMSADDERYPGGACPPLDEWRHGLYEAS